MSALKNVKKYIALQITQEAWIHYLGDLNVSGCTTDVARFWRTVQMQIFNTVGYWKKLQVKYYFSGALNYMKHSRSCYPFTK